MAEALAVEFFRDGGVPRFNIENTPRPPERS